MTAAAAKPHRIRWLDSARGIALIAMAIYHFTWDLELFGYIAQGTAGTGGWKLFARCTAGSFLFIVGISLTLAHTNGIDTKRYLRRTAIIAIAALAITLVTWFAMPSGLIFFGILHHIAVASVLGLACVRLPSVVLLIAAAALIVIGQTVNLASFDPRWLAWIGLYQSPPRSNDFVPLIPWFSAVLAGMVAGRLILTRQGKEAAPLPAPKPLQWLGRHSLAFYLIHQPVLIALVYGFTLINPPAPKPIVFGQDMVDACETQCMQSGDEAFCIAYCRCAFDAASASEVLANPRSEQSMIDLEMSTIANQCEVQTLENVQ